MASIETANEVASMADELVYLRHELETAYRNLAVVTSDRDRLRIENAMLQSQRRDAQDRATRVETILSQTAMSLVAGLKEIHADRDAARMQRREVQRETLEEETREDPPPEFLRRPVTDRYVVHGAQTGRTPAQSPAPSNPPRTPPTVAEMTRTLGGRVNTALAARDSRLPQAEWLVPPDPDDGSLENMAQNAVRAR